METLPFRNHHLGRASVFGTTMTLYEGSNSDHAGSNSFTDGPEVIGKQPGR